MRPASIASLRYAKLTGLTHKTNLDRDPVAGLRSLLSRISLFALNPAIIPLRSSARDSDSTACAGATAPLASDAVTGGIGMKDRRSLRCSFVRACGLALLPEPHTTHIVRDPPVIYSGRTGNPETLCWN